MQVKKRILAFVLLSIAAFSFLGMSVVRGFRASQTGKSDGVYRLLLLGQDDAAELCDVMMVASFDSKEGRMSIVQIPRDTYFAYTQGSYKKINAAARALGGADRLSDKLSEALGVSIDGYMSFDLDFVKDAVDMVGGVELFVPCDMDYDDPEQGLSIHLKKGKQTLTGEEAVGFVRFRSGYVRADLDRMDAQKMFLAAFAKAFSERVGYSELAGVILLGMRHLKTDMRIDTALALAREMRKLPQSSITVLTLPGEEIRSAQSGAWYYILSREGCEEAIREYLATDGEVYAGFDVGRLFTNENRSEFHSLYEKRIPAQPYTFAGLRQKIEDNEIN